MKKKFDLSGLIVGAGFTWIAFIIVAAISWCANIYKLLEHLNDPLTTLQICRLVGTIFFPLGVILGFV